MEWKLEAYSDGDSKVPWHVFRCKSVDAARTRATQLRRSASEGQPNDNVWFRIMDPVGFPHQYTQPSTNWRLKWFWSKN